jgi:transposase InsO family protein
MTDNAFVYTKNRLLRELLAAHNIRHLTTQPYRPRTNGKVERFHQTMAREWAYGRVYTESTERANLLEDWLNHYNRRRPHSAIGDPATPQPRSQRLKAGHLAREVVRDLVEP